MRDDHGTSRPGGPAEADGQAPVHTASIVAELRGDLPCVRCRYNLRGLSVRALCPECRTPVRATILAIVDPHAHQLVPLRAPRLTFAGMLAWSTGALAAALCVWALRAVEIAAVGPAWPVAYAGPLGTLALVVSALGAAVLVSPHAGVPARDRLAALLGIAAYIPLVWVYWHTHVVHDAAHAPPYAGAEGMDGQRVVLRVVSSVLIVMIVVALRPGFRRLASRSVVVRSGRVDRQSMLALAGAIALATVGDLVSMLTGGLRGAPADVARVADVTLIAVGSALFTLGLIGIVLDCWRLRGIILAPPIGIEDIMGDQRTEQGG